MIKEGKSVQLPRLPSLEIIICQCRTSKRCFPAKNNLFNYYFLRPPVLPFNDSHKINSCRQSCMDGCFPALQGAGINLLTD